MGVWFSSDEVIISLLTSFSFVFHHKGCRAGKSLQLALFDSRWLGSKPSPPGY